MAYLPTSEKEKEENGQQSGEAPTIVGSGDSAFVQSQDTQGTSGSQTSTQGAPSKSGSYTNLMNYVTTNSGAGNQMGQAVRGTVENQASQASQNLNTFKQNAQTEADRGTVQTDQNMVKNLQADPTKVDAGAFQNQYNATYRGPQAADQITGYGDTRQAYEKVGSQVEAAGGDLSGRVSLIKDAYNRPTYSRGEQRLDGFILGTGQEGQQHLRGIQDTYGTFGQNFTSGLNQAQQYIDQGRATTEQTRNDVRKAYNDASTKITGDIEKARTQLGADTQADTAEYQQMAKDLIDGDAAVRNAAFAKLGLDETTANYLWNQGFNPRALIAQGKAQGLGDVVSNTTQANYKALLDLVGGQSAFDFQKTGNSGAAYDTNQLQMSQIEALRDLMTGVDTATSAANQARATELNDLIAALERAPTQSVNGIAGPWAAGQLETALGLTPDMIAQARQLGINLKDFVTAGQQLGYGDVMSQGQSTLYRNILNTLGINEDSKFRASPDAKPAYTYNTEGLNQRIAQRQKEEYDRRMAESSIGGPAAGGIGGGIAGGNRYAGVTVDGDGIYRYPDGRPVRDEEGNILRA